MNQDVCNSAFVFWGGGGEGGVREREKESTDSKCLHRCGERLCTPYVLTQDWVNHRA